jgi:hypothetical protein
MQQRKTTYIASTPYITEARKDGAVRHKRDERHIARSEILKKIHLSITGFIWYPLI